MAIPKCGSCNGTSFQAQHITIANADAPYRVINCAQCGAVVGVLGNRSTERLLDDLQRKLERKIDDVASDVRRLAR